MCAVFIHFDLGMDNTTETKSETTVFSLKPAKPDHKQTIGKCNNTIV